MKVKPLRVFLAGPMTGMPEHNIPEFMRVASILRAMGHQVTTPIEVNELVDREQADKPTYRTLLARDLELIAGTTVDVLVLLDGWEQSHGARLEVEMAHELEKSVYELDDFIVMTLVDGP